MRDRLYTMEGLAEASGMSRRTVRRLVDAGMPHYRIRPGGKVFIAWDDFRAFMDQRYRYPKPVEQLLAKGRR